MPLLLSPVAAIYAGATARRMARPGWHAPIPVICCGAVTAGGAGKTTLAIDIGRRLAARGVNSHFLLRGYGGSVKGPIRVEPAKQGSEVVGDEALLLAALAPTWVSADRAEGARRAVEAGAAAIVMDDGLQNPTLDKTISLLTIDGSFGFGNGRVIPAGPLREKVAEAASRCVAAVLIGQDEHGALAMLPPGLPVLRAVSISGPEMAELAGKNVFAFCGIGNPRKFFATLRLGGAVVAGSEAFADHYPFDAGDMRTLLAQAESLGAIPVTTRKDWVRIPAEFQNQVRVVSVTLQWEDPAQLEALLDRAMTGEMAGA
ncbi:tetraacyldisaccharide 4'-kinase [Roseococcus pinisoli]|uniref:Tetraacyldisaccharide 4'-kinase n=1 Tax=Roseococcus pinisoli TaxID=2835040 RepID=A0ABS5Q810_9PROT|nr:tetraacyldisaccharide 4'-kinase [Roseococcus pinisoli]MBS7809817.1 tetraacyldisaccharide 4'-kinase [Roseococcus pinisoli]